MVGEECRLPRWWYYGRRWGREKRPRVRATYNMTWRRASSTGGVRLCMRAAGFELAALRVAEEASRAVGAISITSRSLARVRIVQSRWGRSKRSGRSARAGRVVPPQPGQSTPEQRARGHARPPPPNIALPLRPGQHQALSRRRRE